MRIRSILAATAALVVAAAVPVHAYNPDAYAYGAGHMITAKQIPSSLNARDGGNFYATSNPGKNWLCGDDTFREEYPGGKYSFNIGYATKKTDASSINMSVDQYASATKAIAVWKGLTKSIEKCSGEKSGTETYDDGSTDSWARNTTVGNVPLVTVTGVVSKFMNVNYTDTANGDNSTTYNSDTYSVFTLVNDVIINTTYYTGSELNLTASERKAVNQAAFNAVSAWLR